MVSVERTRMPISSVRHVRSLTSALWVLVAISVFVIPFENEYSLAGFSIAKLAIIPLLFAVVVTQPKRLLSILRQRVFVCALAFVAWGVISEFFRPLSDWEFILRVLQNLIFAALVGAVASNPPAFRRILNAIAIVCSVLALYLILGFYGAVSVDVGSFKEAGYLRQGALSDMGLGTGLNILGYTVSMGAAVALAQLFGSKSLRSRVGWSAVYVLCAIGSFVPLSRGSFVALVGASILIVWRNRTTVAKPGTLVVLIAIFVVAFSLTPSALTERYASLGFAQQEEEAKTGKVEGRKRIFRATIDSFPQYWTLGVGSGYYWAKWGRQNGFRRLGPHNGFFTAWIFYGLPGVLLLGLTCFFAARNLPKRGESSPESTALAGLLVLALFWLLFTHSIYIKSFGVILGLSMGAALGRRLPSTRSVLAAATPIRLRRWATRVDFSKQGTAVDKKTYAATRELVAHRRRF